MFFGFSSIGDNIMKTESPHTNPQNAPNTDGRSLAKKTVAMATAAAAFSSNFLSLATRPNDNNNNSRNACAFSLPLFHFFTSALFAYSFNRETNCDNKNYFSVTLEFYERMPPKM